MAVLCSLRRIRGDDLAYLQRHATDMPSYLYGQSATVSPPKHNGLLAALGLGRQQAPPAPFNRENGDTIALEKSWEVLDYLLTGTANPGDVPLHLFNRDWPTAVDIDVGYSKPMLVSDEDMGGFAQALSALSDQEIMESFDIDIIRDARLDEAEAIAAYPDEARAYLSAKLIELRQFAMGCVAQGAGAILYYH